MQKLDDILKRQKFAVLDGAFATELEKLGLNINDPLWSALALIDREELISKVHLSYLKAGADIITSSSYQATVRGFVARGVPQQRAGELIGNSVRLAQKARDTFVESADFDSKARAFPLVAASLGPFGAYLADGSEYRGNYQISYDELKRFHLERIEIIDRESPDLYALETVPVLAEAVAVSEILCETGITTPLWVSFSCCDGDHISDGTDIAECARRLEQQKNVVAIGVNCTHPRFVESLIKRIKANSTKEIVVYPNSGESYDPVSKTWSGSSEEFLAKVGVWNEAGATMIGGCCRTSPADIEKIALMARG